MFGAHPLFYLIIVHAFMSFLLIILVNLPSFTQSLANLMSLLFFPSFRLMSNNNLITK